MWEPPWRLQGAVREEGLTRGKILTTRLGASHCHSVCTDDSPALLSASWMGDGGRSLPMCSRVKRGGGEGVAKGIAKHSLCSRHCVSCHVLHRIQPPHPEHLLRPRLRGSGPTAHIQIHDMNSSIPNILRAHFIHRKLWGLSEKTSNA